MTIDYKKELENASKGMIMIHDPNLLIRMMVRMIVRKLGVKHAAMILFDAENDRYVLEISRGAKGIKIPKGFTRYEKTSPLIRLFIDKEYKDLILNRNAIVSEDISKLIWRESVVNNGSGKSTRELLAKVDGQMQMLNSEVCVPAYHRDQLMAILLLGEKYDGSKFEQEELSFFAALASDAAMGIRNAQLFEHLQKEAESNHQLFLQTISVLGSAIEAKDTYTHGHTERVTQYAIAIAGQMIKNKSAEFSDQFIEDLYISGLLHDIGKIAVPEVILNKEGRLTDEEYEIIKLHPTKGAEIVESLNLSSDIMAGIKYHHEAFNGWGYPEGLRADDIPMSAAVLAVADAFDAMTSDRSYRKGMPNEKAIKEIKRCANAQFNPLPAKAIVELYEMGELYRD